MEKQGKKLKKIIMMTFIPNWESSCLKWLYNPVVIDFDRKKVDVYEGKPPFRTRDHRRLGVVMGTLQKSGKYVYLAAFETYLRQDEYQSNHLDPASEEVAFYVNQAVWDTFYSNFEKLDERRRKVYSNDCYRYMPEFANFIFTEGKNLTFREAMDVANLNTSHCHNLWFWVAFDEGGNIVNPHVCATWKPYNDTREYEYVSATGRYLYYNLDCINDVYNSRDCKWFCGVVRQKSTGELFEIIMKLAYYCGGNNDEIPLSRQDLLRLLKDERIAEELDGKVVLAHWFANGKKEIYWYKVTHGRLLRVDDTYTTLYKGYFFVLQDIGYSTLALRPNQLWPNPDLEVVDLKDYWRYLKVAHFTRGQYYDRFFVCGMMRQKSTDKIFYLVADFLCECKENGLFLSPEDLQTLLKDDNVAEQFEGKSFWDFKKKCYMSITDRKLHEKSKPDGKSHFVLRDENGVIFDEKFKPSDWELIFPQAEKTV